MKTQCLLDSNLQGRGFISDGKNDVSNGSEQFQEIDLFLDSYGLCGKYRDEISAFLIGVIEHGLKSEKRCINVLLPFDSNLENEIAKAGCFCILPEYDFIFSQKGQSQRHPSISYLMTFKLLFSLLFLACWVLIGLASFGFFGKTFSIVFGLLFLFSILSLFILFIAFFRNKLSLLFDTNFKIIYLLSSFASLIFFSYLLKNKCYLYLFFLSLLVIFDFAMWFSLYGKDQH
jgi:hypothetical protein